FIKRYASAMKKRITLVDKRVIDAFMRYPWPGNVRELQNAVERMISFLNTAELTYELVPEHIRRYRYDIRFHEEPIVKEEERQVIAMYLRQKMRKNRIAEIMNISRATLYRKMKLYGLE
ncbi:MAG: helix-turn-helix domain-containing protein, partial [Syntrophaceae bacterium]|nr:helix-turn-helix domain-containing protein [Syntrophaceae bacterium]